MLDRLHERCTVLEVRTPLAVISSSIKPCEKKAERMTARYSSTYVFFEVWS